MNQLCTACSRKIGPLPSTPLLTTTTSLNITCDATTTREAFQLESFFQSLETESRASQATQRSLNIEELQPARVWHDFPPSSASWSRPAQLPIVDHVPEKDNFGHDEYWRNESTSRCLGVVDTSEPQLPSVGKPKKPSNSGNYRCYQHGCKGRRFSSPENYRRHVRERNQSDRTTCPFCAAVFTRKSNKDTHVRKERCKGLNRWSYQQISALLDSNSSPEGM
jgi:hypothetical protein